MCAVMEIGVLVGLAVAVAGLMLVGLGFYFVAVTWPYKRLLGMAGDECVEIYNGCKKGEIWEVVVSVGSASERHWVEAHHLGRFMLRRALGSFYEQEEAKAKAIEAEVGETLTESLICEWVQDTTMGVMQMDKKVLDAFSSSRREVLTKVDGLLSGQVAWRSRWSQAAD
jgi:hypothetical protein